MASIFAGCGSTLLRAKRTESKGAGLTQECRGWTECRSSWSSEEVVKTEDDDDEEDKEKERKREKKRRAEGKSRLKQNETRPFCGRFKPEGVKVNPAPW